MPKYKIVYSSLQKLNIRLLLNDPGPNFQHKDFQCFMNFKLFHSRDYNLSEVWLVVWVEKTKKERKKQTNKQNKQNKQNLLRVSIFTA